MTTYRFLLNSRSDRYSFFDEKNMMSLTLRERVGTATVSTPNIEKAVKFGVIIDIDKLTNVELPDHLKELQKKVVKCFGPADLQIDYLKKNEEEELKKKEQQALEEKQKLEAAKKEESEELNKEKKTKGSKKVTGKDGEK